VFHETIATVICATALSLCAVPATRAQEAPRAEDRLLAPAGTCIADANAAAHHRTQRLAMHCLLDHLRKDAGLRKLQSNATLRHSAIYKARRIAACKIFTHNPCGDALAVPFREAQLTRRGRWVVGEDLAWDVKEAATARAILTTWLRSPSHRSVLLDKNFSHVGLRRRRLQMKGAPVGAVLWVAHLGRPAKR
jgi:uncharacterized protein YkwD